jgi:hypothetical protein
LSSAAWVFENSTSTCLSDFRRTSTAWVGLYTEWMAACDLMASFTENSSRVRVALPSVLSGYTNSTTPASFGATAV